MREKIRYSQIFYQQNFVKIQSKCSCNQIAEKNVCYSSKKEVKVKVVSIYDPYVREMPVREHACPGPSAM